MSESKAASRFFRVPDDVMGLVAKADGTPIPYPYAAFFLEFQLPRIPNKTTEQNAIVQRLLAMFAECKAGDEWELHAAEWQAQNDSLPQLGDQRKPEITVPVYMRTQDFYSAVFSAPTKKPADWDSTVEPERAKAAE